MDIPLVAPVRQTHPQPAVGDVAGEVRRLWQASGLPRRVKPGARVAVGVGSRGIANLQTMVRATLDVLRDTGALPLPEYAYDPGWCGRLPTPEQQARAESFRRLFHFHFTARRVRCQNSAPSKTFLLTFGAGADPYT